MILTTPPAFSSVFGVIVARKNTELLDRVGVRVIYDVRYKGAVVRIAVGGSVGRCVKR